MTVRWGILGCGDVVRKRVAKAIQDDPNSELLSVCRRDPDKLKQFAQDFEINHAYTLDEDLIADPNIDAVYISTPVDLHLPQTIACAEAGKHVLVEKPMAMSVAECDQMIDACRENNVKLGVAYYRRFYPVVDRIKELIESGEIGKVLSVSAVTATAFAMSPGDDGYWRVLPDQGGGGALMDIGSHRINLFLDLFGAVDKVRAVCGTVAADYDADDCAGVLMQFTSGIQGHVHCYFGVTFDPDEFSVVGTKGRLMTRTLNGGSLYIETVDGVAEEPHPPNPNFNSPLIADFVAAIAEDREPLVSGDEGRKTNAILELAYRDA